MHDLLPFAPRSRTIPPPSNDIRSLVSSLVDDIQVIAGHDRGVVLATLAQFAHEQRVRILDEDERAKRYPG